jgi:hypothetical protein
MTTSVLRRSIRHASRSAAADAAALERIRARLRATSSDESTLRVLLVLAHEAVEARMKSASFEQQVSPRTRAGTSSAASPDDYDTLVARIRDIVSARLPAHAAVLVVSRGDDRLLVPEDAAAHFPQGTSGGYAGFYPYDSEAAVTHLEELRADGAEYLLFPSTAYWWLDYYGGLTKHLLMTARVVHHDRHCLIFDLRDGLEGP